MFHELTGLGILNFGEGGYGLDQSVLKFERHHQKYKDKHNTQISILAVGAEEYRRSVSYKARAKKICRNISKFGKCRNINGYKFWRYNFFSVTSGF